MINIVVSPLTNRMLYSEIFLEYAKFYVELTGAWVKKRLTYPNLF